MIRTPIHAAALALLIALISACGDPRPIRHFGPDAYPARLSDWGVVRTDGEALVLADGFVPYDLNTPLFSDYAHKLRAIWLPPGTQARYDADEVFDLPVGTIITKTFFYPRASGQQGALLATEDTSRDFIQADPSEGKSGDGKGERHGERLDLRRVRLIETRLLVHQPNGWDALAYVWDDAQAEAHLEIAGDMKALRLTKADGSQTPINYLIPTRNECANCHATDHSSGQLHPIGLAARHLNKVYEHYADGPAPQLQRWVGRGYLDRAPEPMPANAQWRAGAFDDLDHRARSYLDVNCGHCHNPKGAAKTSGLFLNAAETSLRRLGACKPPIAAGRGTGGRYVSIMPGQPDLSILTFRIASTDPGIMMPELGRTTVHEEGVELLRRWVESLPGVCT